jgi:hypothetical protein
VGKHWSRVFDECRGALGDKEARKRDLKYKRELLLENGIDATNWSDDEVLIHMRNNF